MIDLITVVEITVGCRLPTESRDLPTNKISENPIITDRFIVFYCLYEDSPVILYINTAILYDVRLKEDVAYFHCLF